MGAEFKFSWNRPIYLAKNASAESKNHLENRVNSSTWNLGRSWVMEHEFYSAVPNRFGAMRLLQPRLYLDKYVSGWQCSVCGRPFDLSPRERHSSAMYGTEVPTRIRHEFEVHSCGE